MGFLLSPPGFTARGRKYPVGHLSPRWQRLVPRVTTLSGTVYLPAMSLHLWPAASQGLPTFVHLSFLGQLSHNDNRLVVHTGRVWGLGPPQGAQEDAATVRCRRSWLWVCCR